MPAHSASRLSSRAGLYVTSIRCVIPEYKVNLDKLIRLLMEEKQANPSNYAMIVLGEGAEWEGYEVEHYGGGSTAPRTPRRLKSGRRLYVEMSFAIVKGDTESEVLGPVAVARDVTERVERERAASRSS